MRSIKFFSAALIALAIGSPALAADRDEIMKKFTGRWEIDGGVNQGVDVPEERLDGTYTVITAKSIITYDRDQKETYKATYTLNTETDPIQIDMVAQLEGKGTKSLGIIKFEWLDLDGEDEFTLAYSLKPGERPTKFESPVGSQIMIFEMEQADD